MVIHNNDPASREGFHFSRNGVRPANNAVGAYHTKNPYNMHVTLENGFAADTAFALTLGDDDLYKNLGHTHHYKPLANNAYTKAFEASEVDNTNFHPKNQAAGTSLSTARRQLKQKTNELTQAMGSSLGKWRKAQFPDKHEDLMPNWKSKRATRLKKLDADNEASVASAVAHINRDLKDQAIGRRWWTNEADLTEDTLYTANEQKLQGHLGAFDEAKAHVKSGDFQTKLSQDLSFGAFYWES